jgi:cobalt/nickel transport system permease protein
MHIPDGFLDAKTWGPLWAVSAAGTAIAARRVASRLDEKTVPLLGVTAAFVFAAQMLNFPIAGGTSGHFTGAVLSVILLGPAVGLLSMASVLAIQCLVFQDGGITALGANIFNMGLVGCLSGWAVWRAFRAVSARRFPLAGAFVAAWAAVVLASSACAVELAIAGTVPLKPALIAMAGVHAAIGLVEGAITVAVLAAIGKARPDLVDLGVRP